MLYLFYFASDAEKMEVHYACVKEEMTKYSTCAGWPRKAVDAHFTKLRNFYKADCKGERLCK